MRVLAITCLTLIFFFGCGMKADPVRLNELTGAEKWKGLETYLLKQRSFGSPPTVFWEFQEKGVLSRVSGGGMVAPKFGNWKIDPQSGFLEMRVGEIAMKFRSFRIDKAPSDDKVYYSVQLCFRPDFYWPTEPGAFLTSADHFILGANVGD